MKFYKKQGPNTATDSGQSDCEETHYTLVADEATIKSKWKKEYADNRRKKRH